MLSLVASTVAAFTALIYLLNYFYVPKHSPNEPPLLPSRIPYIGHILGLLRYGTRYFEITRQAINCHALQEELQLTLRL